MTQWGAPPPQQQWGQQQPQPPQQQWGGQQQAPPQPGYTGPGAPPPPPEGGASIKLGEHLGDLIWLKVKRYDPDFVGQYGAKPAIIIDVQVLGGRTEVGKRFLDSLHTNYVLVGQLAERVGQEFFGRIAEQPGTQGALYLAPPQPGDEPYIQQFLAQRGAQPQQNVPQAQPQAQAPQQGWQAPSGQQGWTQGQLNGMPPAQPPPMQQYPAGQGGSRQDPPF